MARGTTRKVAKQKKREIKKRIQADREKDWTKISGAEKSFEKIKLAIIVAIAVVGLGIIIYHT